MHQVQSDSPGRMASPPSSSVARMIVRTIVIVAAAFVFVDRLLLDFSVSLLVDEAIEASALALTTATVLWFAVIRPLGREADAERRLAGSREAALVLHAQQQEFESALHRAVEMTATEEEVYRTAAKAIINGVSHLGAELLLADSSDSHLKRAVEVGGEDRHARCGVIEPRDCPAIRRAQTLTFASSEHLDACPHLENRPTGPCAAMCVPVSVGGRSIGVLHAGV